MAAARDNVPFWSRAAATHPGPRHTAVKTLRLCPRSGARQGRFAVAGPVCETLFRGKAAGSSMPRTVRFRSRLVAATSGSRAQLGFLSRGCRGRFQTDGPRMKSTCPRDWASARLARLSLEELVPYIDWAQFFAAWEMRGKFPRSSNNPTRLRGPQAFRRREEISRPDYRNCWLRASGVYALWPAASSGDDIILYEDDTRQEEKARLHNLRQQWLTETRRCYFLQRDSSPRSRSGPTAHMGGFAVTGRTGNRRTGAALRGRKRRL